MARIATNQIAVLEAVIARLIAAVDGFSARNCILTAQPPQEPPENIHGDYFATVSPTNGRFDEGVHEGAGIEGTLEYAGVVIVIFSRIKLDRVGHDTALLTDASRGLLELKRLILRALSGHDLMDESGDSLLANFMAPLRSDSPNSTWEKGGRGPALGDLALTFSTDLLWDLSADPEEEP